jgi:hypothetical protein
MVVVSLTEDEDVVNGVVVAVQRSALVVVVLNQSDRLGGRPGRSVFVVGERQQRSAAVAAAAATLARTMIIITPSPQCRCRHVPKTSRPPPPPPS